LGDRIDSLIETKTVRFVLSVLLVLALIFPLQSFFYRTLFLIVLGLGHLFLNRLRLGKRKTPILRTLAISHFAERIRWILDKADIPYSERRSYPLYGVFFSGRTIPVLELDGRSELGDSLEIITYLRGRQEYQDSQDLFLNVTPDDRELLQIFETQLAPHVRRALYYYLFTYNPVEMSQMWATKTSPLMQAISLKLLPVSKFLLFRALNIHPESVERSWAKIDEVLDLVDVGLNDGTKFLGSSESLSLLDISFVSFMAPLLLIPYGGAKFPKMDQLHPNLIEKMEQIRQRKCAKWAFKMWDRHRKAVNKKQN